MELTYTLSNESRWYRSHLLSIPSRHRSIQKFVSMLTASKSCWRLGTSIFRTTMTLLQTVREWDVLEIRASVVNKIFGILATKDTSGTITFVRISPIRKLITNGSCQLYRATSNISLAYLMERSSRCCWYLVGGMEWLVPGICPAVLTMMATLLTLLRQSRSLSIVTSCILSSKFVAVCHFSGNRRASKPRPPWKEIMNQQPPPFTNTSQTL
jgi:hypothetical protein